MWKLISIADKQYYFQCHIEDEMIKYLLYDLNKIWEEKLEVEVLLERAKSLNKRIQYDNDTILETIQANNPKESTFINISNLYKLRLKYELSGHPFNFEWNLRSMSIDETKTEITLPLFMTVHYMNSQITELKEIIKKKDIEIEQYKIEGAELRRTTVATSPFDENNFNRIYEQINEKAKSFLEISSNLSSDWKHISKSIEEKRNDVKKNDSKFVDIGNAMKPKSTQHSKKRRFFEMRRNKMKSMLQAQKQKLEYDLNDSQSPPIDELADIEKSLKELEEMRKADLKSRQIT